MGTDYMPGEGIVTDVETLVKIINDKNKEAIVKAIRKWLDQGDDDGSIFKDLADDITVDDLKAKLIAQ